MSKSYRLGLRIVLSTILVSGIVCWVGINFGESRSTRAAHDLGASALPLGDFRFQERNGREITQNDLRDRVWVAAFIFTRCPLSCPRISTVMQTLQKRLARSNALLVSISVDPEHDSPPVLKAYADRFNANPDRWWFLTGTKSATYSLIHDGFKLALTESSAADRSEGAEMFAHSDRLALVDGGRVVGLFESNDETALDELVSRANRLSQPQWVRVLPTVNASLNALCAVLLLAGWVSIKRGSFAWEATSISTPNLSPNAGGGPLDRPGASGHVACMLSAVAASAVFLTCYLIYHFLAGSMPFPREGAIRWLYLTILLSHTLLATFGVVPLVSLTLVLAARRDFVNHARIAKITFPIWIYVLVTGVVIYLLLYHLPVASSLGQ